MKKVLLDENIPRPLKKHFSEALEVFTVHDLGWESKENGELIKAMLDADITILTTADRNIQYQQNLDKYPIKLVVLITHDNRYKTLIPKVPIIETAILNMEEKQLIQVDLR